MEAFHLPLVAPGVLPVGGELGALLQETPGLVDGVQARPSPQRHRAVALGGEAQRQKLGFRLASWRERAMSELRSSSGERQRPWIPLVLPATLAPPPPEPLHRMIGNTRRPRADAPVQQPITRSISAMTTLAAATLRISISVLEQIYT